MAADYDIPAVNRRISSMHSRMSSRRSLHSLGGTDGLSKDPVAELTLDGAGHHEVHLAPEELLQAQLQADEVEQPDRSAVELDEEVDVALRPGVVAGHRTE